MSNSCSPAPTNKKEYIKDLGLILVQDHGKKQYYKPEEVKKAHKKSKWYRSIPDAFSCWGMSTYSSHADFDQYHQQTGEACDYAEMKAEMLAGLSTADSDSWLDVSSLNLSSVDIDASWIDFGDVFESVFDGIGEFVAGILDGI